MPPVHRNARRWGRHRLSVAIVLAAVVVASTADEGIAQEPGGTALLVRVADESGNGIGDQEVFVVISDGEEVVEELTGTTEADGLIRFDGIANGGRHTARAVTVFEGYPYQSEGLSIAPGDETVLPLTVFTIADGPVNLHINVVHIIINIVQPGVYQALQIIEVLNTGQRAGYTAEEFEGRRVGQAIPILSGATNVTPTPTGQIGDLDPANLAIDGNRLLDLRPVPPGPRQVAIHYDLLTGSGGRTVELSVPYPTAQVSILTGPGLDAVEINSDQLTELAPATDIPSGPFAHWGSDVLSAGDTLRFRLGPQGPTLSVSSWALLGLAIALFASAVASMWAGRSPVDPGDRERLIAEVARLDRMHGDGALRDIEYHARRGEALGRLVQLQGNQPTEQSPPSA